MKTKNDESVSQTEKPSEKPSGQPQTFSDSNYKLSELAYRAANSLTTTVVTACAVVVVQSPIKTALIHLTNGAGMPSYSSIGTLGFFRALYAGTIASLASSTARTAYVTAAKTGKPAEAKESSLHEEKPGTGNLQNPGPYVFYAAWGDIVITQVSETLSTLRKVNGLLPEGFLWYKNIPQLMTNGLLPRYASGLVNFGALCILEDEIAKKVPFKDSKWRHLTAGALSGIAAGLASYPFAVLKDYVVIQAKVNEQNLLVNKSTFKVLGELGKAFFQSPREMGKTFLVNTLKQAPLRAGLTGGIFSVIAIVGETMGPEPLKAVKKHLTNSQNFFTQKIDTENSTSPSKTANPPEKTTSSTSTHR
ncbi:MULTISPECIES: hypothetical protein [Legionella]|uniref:Periplasmic ligand-binding sensor domain protein n=1 Tax=Legionella drozanskii LLAP-1 TaxID=1212489 RepID=A0A0W0TC11_9GAMM|nr:MULTISPECIES: hypothetical protein [Legionella]KTC93143.1 periplasmic ligand-binding sensor domain protein [Legionella drozanskii LLAP-1]PJE09354.1 MAG: hypothetical protein CK430_11215 [Legionella sp.]